MLIGEEPAMLAASDRRSDRLPRFAGVVAVSDLDTASDKNRGEIALVVRGCRWHEPHCAAFRPHVAAVAPIAAR
jgi:hypothetical protein